MATSVAPIPFNPSAALGGASQAGAGYYNSLEDTGVSRADDLNDLSTQSSRLQTQYNDVTAPQLQGSIATSGNWFSGATSGQPSIGQGAANYQNAQTDLSSSVQRQLNSLTEQRNWAAIGLIV